MIQGVTEALNQLQRTTLESSLTSLPEGLRRWTGV